MKTKTYLVALLVSLLLSGFGIEAQAQGKSVPGDVLTGIASYYHDSLDGLQTASGEIYSKNRISAAHKSLPLGTRVKVTDTETGNSIIVTINDRGPYVKGRIIDLSRAAARKLGMIRQGIVPVKVTILSMPVTGS